MKVLSEAVFAISLFFITIFLIAAFIILFSFSGYTSANESTGMIQDSTLIMNKQTVK